jgi:glycosyltransferase involved in cell wall biosynthesis
MRSHDSRAADAGGIVVDSRWIGPHGIGRFAAEVIRRLPGIVPLPLAGAPLAPFDSLRLHLLLRRVRPDVFFTPGFNPPLGRPCRTVITIHDLIHLRFSTERGISKEAYYRLVVRPGARAAASVLTVSRFSRDEILAWTGLPESRVRVVGNGVGPEFNPMIGRHEPGYPYLLFVGGDKPHKNLEGLLTAFSHARARREMRLIIVGKVGARLRTRAAQLHITDRLAIEEAVPYADLPSYYRGATLLAFPSLYEGFGLPALEAMACGIPVLASDRASIPEVVGEAALKCDPTSVEGIAAGIDRLIEDEELRSRLVIEGPARAALFSWDTVAEGVRKAIVEAKV